MKKLTKIYEVLRNVKLKELSYEQKELWLRARIVIQFVTLREQKGYNQQRIADKMGVLRQQITRFENMSNSPTISFLVRYATALDTTVDVILNGVDQREISNGWL